MPQPVVTATLQITALGAVSNILAQGIDAYMTSDTLEPHAPSLVELLRFVTLLLLIAPPNYKWQQFLERTFPAYPSRQSSSLPQTRRDVDVEKSDETTEHSHDGPKPELSLVNIGTKTFVDCGTFGALFNTVAFLIIMGLLKGQGIELIWHNLWDQTIPIILASYNIWPVTSWITNSSGPRVRIVFLSFMGVSWGIYMSMVAREL